MNSEPTKPTLEEMRAAWEANQKRLKQMREYTREYRKRPEVKAKMRENNRELHRLAKLAKEAGLA